MRILRVTASQDVPWDSYDVDIWAAVEINAGIFCVSAPAVKPLLHQIAPGLLSSIGTDTNLPSNSRKYGGGTGISRISGNKNNAGFELSRNSNIDFPPKDPNVVHKSWIDFEGKRSDISGGSDEGDAESERAIMEKEVRDGEIRKTVRVMVEGSKKEGLERGGDGYIAGENGVGRSECV